MADKKAGSNGRPKGGSSKNKGGVKRRPKNRSAKGTVITIIVIIGVGIGVMVALQGGPKSSDSASPGAAAQPNLVSATDLGKVTDVSPALVDAASQSHSTVQPPKPLPASTPPLTSNGKPEIVYIGAEYCPYCAAQRWALTQALSRFGTFTNVGETTSSSTDVYADTPTFSYSGSKYTSPYVVFTPVEMKDRNGQPLDKPTAAQQALLAKYDAPPYVDASSKGAIPFLYIGGKYQQVGTSLNPQLLSGMSFSDITASIQDQSSATGQSILGAANFLTASICETTGQKPADVCSAAGVTAAAQQLAAG